MRRGAVIAWCGVALVVALGLPGCAAARPRARPPRDAGKRHGESSAEAVARCRVLSEAAQAAIDRGDGPTALAYLQEMLTFEPRSAETYHRLGQVYQSEGRLAEAGAAYHKAL